MKHALQYIKALFGYYQFYYNSSIPNLTSMIGRDISQYLNENYNKLDGSGYFYVTFDSKNNKYEFHIDKSFENDFIKHYPEKLI